MPLTEEDLKFRLAVDVDKKSAEAMRKIMDGILGVEDELVATTSYWVKELGKLSAIKEVGPMMSRLSRWANEILDAVDARSRSEKKIDDYLKSQEETLKDIRAEMEDPDKMRERLLKEEMITKAKDAQAKAEKKMREEMGLPKNVTREATIGERLASAYKGGGAGGGFKEIFSIIKDGLAGLKKGGGGKLIGGMLAGGGGGGGMGSLLAAGGPEGAVLAMIPVAVKGLSKLAALPYAAIGVGLSTVATGLAGLQGPLGPIGAGLNMLSASMKSVSGAIKSIPIVGSLLGPMLDAMDAIPGMIADITASLVNMAAKASPGAFKAWQIVLDDVQATVGRSFVPMLQLMTKYIRYIGDVLATVLPSMSEVREALAPLADAWREIESVLRDVWGTIGPIIRQFLIGALQLLGNVLKGLAIAVKFLLTPMTELFRMLGMGAQNMRSSMGAAARPAQIQGLEEYERALQTAAYGAGFGSTEGERQISWLETINNTIKDLPKAIAQAFRDFVLGSDRTPGGQMATATGSAVGRITGTDPFGISATVGRAVARWTVGGP